MRLPVLKPALAEGILLGFTAFAVLWRGGKTLDATWLLVAVAALCMYSHWNARPVQKEQQRIPWVLWSTGLAFFAWTVVSFFWSSTQNYGLDELLRDGSLLLIFYWCIRRAASPEGPAFIRRFGLVCGGAVIAACFVGMAVYALQPVSRFVGTFFDHRFHVDYWPNAWAELLLLAWPLLALQASKGGWKAACAVTGFIIGCLLLSFSRGAFLCFVGQTALLALVGGFGVLRVEGLAILKRTWTGVQFAVCAMVIAASVFAGMNLVRGNFHDIESLARKATFTADEGTSSVDERQLFWKAASTLALEKPFTGWGPYSFRFVQPRLQTGVYQTSDHPHNVFLKLAMERGIPAAALFALLLLLILVPAGWKLLRQPKDSSSALRLMLFVGVAGVLAHNLIDYNLQFVGIALPFWIMLGVLSATEAKGSPRRQRSVEILLAMLLLLTAVLEGRHLVLSSLGRRAERTGDLQSALQWYAAADGEILSRDMHLGRATLLLHTERFTEAQSALDTYMRTNAEDARAWKLFGDIAKAEKDDARALLAYTKAWEFGRYNYPSLMTEIAQLLSRQNHPDKDTYWKRQFVELHAAYANAILQNTHFIALSDAVEEYRQASKVLDRVYPGVFPSIEHVLQQAETERKRLGGRQRGILW